MRLSPLILACLLASAAAAQTSPAAPKQQPSPDKPDVKPQQELVWKTEPVGPGSKNRLSDLPPGARLSVMVDGVQRTVSPPELQELVRQGKKIGSVAPGPPAPPACKVDYSKIDAEQRASDEHLRKMKRDGQVEPVASQIEQELYYQDRRQKLREKTCGKSPPPAYASQYKPVPDMQQETCKAMGKVCKPAKHW